MTISLQTDYACQSPNEVDNLMSKELLQLSLLDRNEIYEEIHGVLSLAPKESPQFLDSALLRLSEELDLILADNNGSYNCSPSSKAAFKKSQEFPNTYIDDRDFRLRFIRSEMFDAKKAAIRMVKFLDIAYDLFGKDALKQPIQIKDLTKAETKHMRTGVLQILPYRDRSGRPIFAWVGDFSMELGDSRARVRRCLYMLYSLSDDVESQRKGIIVVCWTGSNTSITSLPTQADIALIKRMHEGTPIRTCSVHFCLPDKPYLHAMRAMIAMSLGDARSRLRFHIGEDVELRYKLKCYGIPTELIPVTESGNIKTVYFKQWMRLRKILESIVRTNQKKYSNNDDDSIIECPRSNDVIFRTGTALTCHPGNAMLQSVMESKMQEHSAASQVGKTAITKEIIDEVKRKKGRFLQWDSRGWWTELTGKTIIHTKVAVSVRDFKSKSIAQQNRQTCESSETKKDNTRW